jgi:hypothetical protein
MQDTLLEMTKSSIKRFVNSVIYFLPINVQIVDSNTVVNNYFTKDEEKAMGAKKEKMPLFFIDLMMDKNTPAYSTDPVQVVETVKTIFQAGLNAL